MHPLRNFRGACAAVALASLAGTIAAAQTIPKYRPPVASVEVSAHEPMPAGFGVQPTDVDGPVFTDSRGMTLYTWPYRNMQREGMGDRRGKPSTCTDAKVTETTGEAAIYPGGLVLPDLDTRPNCLQAWPAVFAAPDAKPVGKWSVQDR